MVALRVIDEAACPEEDRGGDDSETIPTELRRTSSMATRANFVPAAAARAQALIESRFHWTILDMDLQLPWYVDG